MRVAVVLVCVAGGGEEDRKGGDWAALGSHKNVRSCSCVHTPKLSLKKIFTGVHNY